MNNKYMYRGGEMGGSPPKYLQVIAKIVVKTY